MGQIKNIKLHIVTDIKNTGGHRMGYLEIRNEDSWQGACEDLVNQIHELGFHPGQIYAIDVHNNGWDTHYQWADDRVSDLKGDGKRIIALSHTINCSDRGVTVLWYEHHNPYKFL